ncbi:MAG: hypothetical protein ABIH23_08360 [bacterium]
MKIKNALNKLAKHGFYFMPNEYETEWRAGLFGGPIFPIITFRRDLEDEIFDVRIQLEHGDIPMHMRRFNRNLTRAIDLAKDAARQSRQKGTSNAPPSNA